MKRFDELSDAEILALTEEQIAYYHDFACAEEGAPLMPPPVGPAPEAVEAQHDMKVYQVAGVYFSTMEDASRVADAMNSCRRLTTEYARGGSYRDKVAKVADAPESVTTEPVYSQAMWDSVRQKVTAYNEAKSAWEKRRDEYNKAAELRARVTAWISERIERVHEAEIERRRCEAEFARYVEIARGDRAMAREFLVKARPEAAQFIAPIAEACSEAGA